jgi:hypothetical protein
MLFPKENERNQVSEAPPLVLNAGDPFGRTGPTVGQLHSMEAMNNQPDR